MDLTNAQNSSDTVIDLQQVDTTNWMERPFPAVAGRQSGAIPVVIKQSILNAIHRHGQERTDVEICGVLIGNCYRDEQGAFIYVEGAIRGDHAESQIAQVTFTGETWNHIHTILDSAWPQHCILAWYHTHPGFGIFLSGMDLFIHENFFGGAHQFALVYDPLSGDEGIFVWQQGKPTKVNCLVELDEAAEPRKIGAAHRADMQMTAGALSLTSDGDWREQVAQIRKRQRGIVIALVVIGAMAILWPVIAIVIFGRAGIPKADTAESADERLSPGIPVDDDTRSQFRPITPSLSNSRQTGTSKSGSSDFPPQDGITPRENRSEVKRSSEEVTNP